MLSILKCEASACSRGSHGRYLPSSSGRKFQFSLYIQRSSTSDVDEVGGS